ncbi:RNA ligase family protein [Micromonospora sp. NPDC050397]|uniref:RNA ligase family protein n=1 Tax=Micromonospora sp. NPDC050397 TaxID=3364279 RepID=UPI00384AA92B
MTDFDVRTANLRALNSLTKYPSIPTYHALDPGNGGLTDKVVEFVGRVHLTEKVDGTNSRIVVLPDRTYLIGSREELLYAEGDLIGNPALGIVDALLDVASAMAPYGTGIVTYYFEVYGGKVTAASKHYTGSRRVGHRVFDICVIDDYATMLDWPTERVSSWRDHGGQRFLDEDELLRVAAGNGLATVPRLDVLDAAELPTDIDKTHQFLVDRLPRTTVALDGTPGRPEGIVLRSGSRSVIAKARFQDYERTLRRRSGGR